MKSLPELKNNDLSLAKPNFFVTIQNRLRSTVCSPAEPAARLQQGRPRVLRSEQLHFFYIRACVLCLFFPFFYLILFFLGIYNSFCQM